MATTESLKDLKFILSSRFIKVLKEINSEISDAFLEAHKNIDNIQSRSFADIDINNDDAITFIQSNKAGEILNITSDKYLVENPSIVKSLMKLDITHDVYNRHRVSMRIGRFVNTVFPNRFPASLRAVAGQKSRDVENFVRMYKSIVGQEEKIKLLDIVKGSNISKWYNSKNYDTLKGSLGGSCMSRVSRSFLSIYDKNTKSVSLVILYKNKKKTKIVARAILWTLHNPTGRCFLDRIYTNDSSDEQIFIDYAKKNGWLYKGSQSYGRRYSVTDPLIDKSRRTNLQVKLKFTKLTNFPYMDTMYYMDTKNKTLSNQPRGANYTLTSTGGGRSSHNGVQPNEEFVQSKYHDDEIPKSDAHFCYFGDDWIYSDEAIRVYNVKWKDQNRLSAIPGHPRIVKSNIPGINYVKHFVKKSCIWSDYLNTWIFHSSKVDVFLNKEKTKIGFDHKKRKNTHFVEINGYYYAIHLARKVNDRWELI